MGDELEVAPADSRRAAELRSSGWVVVARSWGSRLDADRVDRGHLAELVARGDALTTVRELTAGDTDAALVLDAATEADYPGNIATRHEPLDEFRATPSGKRRAFGAFTSAGELVAMTFVDIDGVNAEVVFTAVHRSWRGQGLGSAVKAASMLALFSGDVRRCRTGGSIDNPAIIAANAAVGYVRDEEWVTLADPG